MTDPTNITQIGQVGTVFVPVADQERVLGFYINKLGFEKGGDFSYGKGSRWVGDGRLDHRSAAAGAGYLLRQSA